MLRLTLLLVVLGGSGLVGCSDTTAPEPMPVVFGGRQDDAGRDSVRTDPSGRPQEPVRWLEQ